MYMAIVGFKKHDFEDVLEYSEELGAFPVSCKFCSGHHYMNQQKCNTTAELFSCLKTKVIVVAMSHHYLMLLELDRCYLRKG